MKIKTVAALCKKHKRVIILERTAAEANYVQQYLSDGYGVYPVFGLPRLDKKTILTIFDIAAEEQERWHVSVIPAPTKWNLRDDDTRETLVEHRYNPIVHTGRTIQPVEAPCGTVFLNASYLDPVQDVKDLQLYVRETAYGEPYFAVKSGLMLQAVIMPVNVVNETFIEEQREMLRGCERVLDRGIAEVSELLDREADANADR